MRRKPVTRDEIRFDGRRITTMPIDSVSLNSWGDPDKPIAKLWAPLLRSLNRQLKREWNADAPLRAAANSVGIRGHKPPEPVTAPYPFRAWQPCVCEQCGAKFYRARFGSRRYHSDTCAELAHAAKRAAYNVKAVKERSEQRAAARADRHCETCGAPLKAQRSTARFCPGSKCRQTAFRARMNEADDQMRRLRRIC